NDLLDFRDLLDRQIGWLLATDETARRRGLLPTLWPRPAESSRSGRSIVSLVFHRPASTPRVSGAFDRMIWPLPLRLQLPRGRQALALRRRSILAGCAAHVWDRLAWCASLVMWPRPSWGWGVSGDRPGPDAAGRT